MVSLMRRERQMYSKTEHLMRTLSDLGISVNYETKILDFGCGNGQRVNELRKKNCQAWGCDFEHGKHTDRNNQYIRYIKLDPYTLPFDNSCFDIVLSSNVIEHIQKKTYPSP